MAECASFTPQGRAMSDSWPEAEAVAALFQRLRTGDPLARSDFIHATLDPLLHHLRRWRRDADEHACLTAAEDAILALLRNTGIYDPAGRTLIGFLRMSAEGDLRHELAKEARHHRNRDSAECVELVPDDGNNSPDERADDLPSFDDPAVAAELASFTATKRAVFELMREGERATPAFAAVLGIVHLSADEQSREVKRVKDRIIKRLQRAGGKP